MIDLSTVPELQSFAPKLKSFWDLSASKLKMIEKKFDPGKGSPVLTVKGKYVPRGWTEWTQGFQYGSEILQFDATGDASFLESGRKNTIENMAPHVSHTGVHDHGFNNVSTYGNLLRLIKEGKINATHFEKDLYELALKISAAVQASRWTTTKEGGFIHSFNGPHSLFVDTVRSVRVLILGYKLGHHLQAENDIKISLLERAVQHLTATARYSVFYGEGRDIYDEPGRTAHECIFNVKDGNYRCPNSQQGYTGFTTWTRGLAWAICGFAEELEWFSNVDEKELAPIVNKEAFINLLVKAARNTSDFYLKNTPSDGIPYWDTGAPKLKHIDDHLNKPADPYNDFEPVDSSAAAIACQGLLRLGRYLDESKDQNDNPYWNTGLKIFDRLLGEPYLSSAGDHEGLLLHSIYHRPNGWDYTPKGSKIPCGESSMWGDYHFRETALYLQHLIKNESYYTFFNI